MDKIDLKTKSRRFFLRKKQNLEVESPTISENNIKRARENKP